MAGGASVEHYPTYCTGTAHPISSEITSAAAAAAAAAAASVLLLTVLPAWLDQTA